MRVVSGKFKGRTIRPPKNLPVRPTTDMAKEGLFNILNNRIDFEETSVLDLFCGTGNISIEFASRGATDITSVDGNFRCVGFVNSLFKDLDVSGAKAIKSDCLRFVANSSQKWDLIFADPPYDYPNYATLVSEILSEPLLAEGGLLIVEHPKEVNLESFDEFKETRKYGRVHFSFFELKA